MDAASVAGGSTSGVMTPGVIWHALTAVFAWAVLAPVCQLLNRLASSSSSSSSSPFSKYSKFAVHRTSTLVILVLTVQAYFVALYTSSHLNTTSDNAVTRKHPMFASLLVFLTIAQATGGFLRPPPQAEQPESGKRLQRQVWQVSHTLLGVGLMLFGLWILQHSAHIFDVDPWLRVATYAATAFGTTVTLAALVVAVVERATHTRDRSDSAQVERDDYQTLDGECVSESESEGESGHAMMDIEGGGTKSTAVNNF